MPVFGYPKGKVSKSIKFPTLCIQFWNGLSTNQKEQVLQTIDWLGQNRQDYLDNINRLIAGRHSNFQVHWKR